MLAIALKFALNFSSAETLAWFRMLVASLGLSLIFVVRSPGQFSILKSLPWMGLVAGVCLALNYVGFMKGIALTSASHTQIMIQFGPLTLALVGIFYFKEKPSRLQIAGFISALLGFSLFYWDQLDMNLNDMDQFVLGTSWILFAALVWALFASLQKKLTVKWSPQQINLLIYFVSTVVLMPFAEFSELGTWSPGIWLLMIVCGLNTLVAYGCLGEALKRIPASHISLIISANPLLTLALIAFLTQIEVSWLQPEPVHFKGYIGAVLVVTGLILTIYKRAKKSPA